MSIRKTWSERKGRYVWKVVCRRRPDQKQVRATFDSESEAILWKARQLAGEWQRDELPGAGSQGLTFQCLADRWWDLYAHELSANTQRVYAGVLDNYLVPRWGALLCDEVTLEEVEAWHQQSDLGSARRPQRVLRQIFRWGLERGLVNHDPTRILRLPRSRSASWTYLSREEVLTLLRGNQGESCYPLLLVAIYTGLRIGELCALDRTDIDLVRNTIHVCRHMEDHTGRILQGTKGSRPQQGLIKERTLAIPDAVRPVCVQLVQRQELHCFDNALGRRLRQDTTRRYLRAALQRAGVRAIRFHDLRHTFASHFMMSGGDLYELQQWLGHESITMTERYTHLSPEHLQQSRNTIDLGMRGLQVVSSKL